MTNRSSDVETPSRNLSPRPKAPPFPTREQVPPELLLLIRWVCWKYALDENGKWTKQPHSPLSGERAAATPPEKWGRHWSNFDTALAGAKRFGMDGVGFVFVEGEGYVGIDFDHCCDPQTGVFRAKAREWLNHLDTYAEISPSETGAHVIARGSLPGPGNKQPMPDDVLVGVEMYDKKRYLTFTGRRLENHPLQIRDIQPKVSALHKHVFGDLRPEPSADAGSIAGACREFISDESIMKRISAFKGRWIGIFNQEKKSEAASFVQQHYNGDDSVADMALCVLLTRYTLSPQQVERLWKRSILWREKSANRADYRLATINRAFSESQKSKPQFINTTNLAEVSWLWPGRFPRGKLIMLDGDPGLSKSMFSLAVAVSVMMGKPLLDGLKPEVTGGVVLLSAEDDLRDTINPRLLAAGAPRGQVQMIHVSSTKPDGGQFSIADPNDRFELEMMIARADAKLVIIDPLNAYLGEKTDSHNDQKIRQVLGPLSEIANRTGAVVLCLRHLAKSGGGKAMYRGMGSIGYTAAARANFFVAEHPEEKETFVIAASKFNLGPRPVSLKYKLAFSEVKGISSPVPYVSGGAPCELTANELSASQDEATETEGKLGKAVAFLREVLSRGPMKTSQVERLARQEGHREMTLRRARGELKVKVSQMGRSWFWQLPDRLSTSQGTANDLPF